MFEDVAGFLVKPPQLLGFRLVQLASIMSFAKLGDRLDADFVGPAAAGSFGSHQP